ncbi:hypothetical protein SAMN03159376_01140 [Pseudomonas sp. NFACC09-4]|jgi:hypothetical protein|uniref:hypothetical protein n=1 Tax=Pseudomonas TaxID=286 RepID=UPI000908B7A8|nr:MULTISPECIES: hypothetical protein [Pseudomonas]MDT8908614.1 hypothetical protein [Pseudomonas prosekii]NHN71360.1 hypothetical protein [Pseudomonas fluorescens]ROO41534.1 hypothetical protein BIV08_11735 [Pseudomonas sp. AF76]SFW35745.1 hypothetical protein SAMN03159376_01140 [Pseudomonas sp. NFACC09-4]
MDQYLYISIAFDDASGYSIPTTDKNRELFLGADIGNFINLTIENRLRFGTIEEKTLWYDTNQNEWHLHFYVIERRAPVGSKKLGESAA